MPQYASYRATIGTTRRMPGFGIRILTTIGRIRTTMSGCVATTISPQIRKRNSGITGMHYPALSEINRNLLFGRETEDQGVSIN